MYDFKNGIGICVKCGDTQGPWTLTEEGWVCDDCYEKGKENEASDCTRSREDESFKTE